MGGFSCEGGSFLSEGGGGGGVRSMGGISLVGGFSKTITSCKIWIEGHVTFISAKSNF